MLLTDCARSVALAMLTTVFGMMEAQSNDTEIHEPDADLDEISMIVIRRELQRYHQNNLMILERECYMAECQFSRARRVIGNPEKVTRYWSYLNCVKYGRTCPRNGQWSKWGEYQSCSARCGDGFKVRWRHCTAPHPLYGGLKCPDKDHELASCEGNEGWKCAFDPSLPGVWEPWGSWSHCLGGRYTGGTRTRLRRCVPTYNSSDCEGYADQKVACRRATVDVNGQWSDWEQWSDCSSKLTCGLGVRIRKRSCSRPYVSGKGTDCIGSSAETKNCLVHDCETEIPLIAHFLPNSYLRYKKIPPAYYLNVYLKFFPNSADGLLFQYSTQAALQEAAKSGSVKIKKPKVHKFVNVGAKKEDKELEAKIGENIVLEEEENFVYAALVSSEDIEVHINLNASREITIPMHGVINSHWNELRVTIITDMVWLRLNDGENIVSRLEDFMNNTVTDEPSVSGFISKFSNLITETFNPERRQIFAYFDGEMGLGAVRQGLGGFRGYMSHFAVNHCLYTLRAKPEHEISKFWDPFRGMHMHYGRGWLAYLSLLTHFNGRQSVELPLTASWVKEMSSGSPLGKTFGETATYEFVLLSECDDGLFFYIQSDGNRFTHWKLSIEERRRVRLTMSYGGDITILESEQDLHTNYWNKVVLQLVRTGLAHLEVNGKSYYVKMPDAVQKHQPHTVAFIGGYGKPIQHDALLGEDLSSELLKELKSFVGYIYSVRQNNVLYLIEDLPQVNTFHMPSSFFMAKTDGSSRVIFLPTTLDGLSAHKTDDFLAWDEKSEHPTLVCALPFLKNSELVSVRWYRNDREIGNSEYFWSQEYTTEDSHISTLSFGKVLDSSRDHSGIYQCVMKYFSESFVVKTFAVAAVPEDVARYGKGGLFWFLRGLSVGSVILVIAGSLAGSIIALLLLVSCIRFVLRLISDRKAAKTSRAAKNKPHSSHSGYSGSSSEESSSFERTVGAARKTRGSSIIEPRFNQVETRPLLESDSDEEYEERQRVGAKSAPDQKLIKHKKVAAGRSG